MASERAFFSRPGSARRSSRNCPTPSPICRDRPLFLRPSISPSLRATCRLVDSFPPRERLKKEAEILKRGPSVTCSLTSFAAVDELSRVHAFGGEKELFSELVAIGIAKNDACEWSSSTRIVDYFLDYAFEIAATFGVVACA